MAGIIIAEIDVREPGEYESYKRQAERSLEAFGAAYLVRGGAAETLEGDWDPKRIVVLRFDSVARAREWWTSEEYGPAREIRQRSAATRMILVEGT